MFTRKTKSIHTNLLKGTYKFWRLNNHIEALERHLQTILCTGYQPQRYKELLRGTELLHVANIIRVWTWCTLEHVVILTCLLRKPLRSESAKSQIYKDTHESMTPSAAGKQGNCVNRLIWLCAHFPKNQISQARPLQEHSCISRSHSPAAVWVDLHTTNTQSYSIFPPQHQRNVFSSNSKSRAHATFTAVLTDVHQGDTGSVRLLSHWK